jgi:hypothetical protein
MGPTAAAGGGGGSGEGPAGSTSENGARPGDGEVRITTVPGSCPPGAPPGSAPVAAPAPAAAVVTVARFTG